MKRISISAIFLLVVAVGVAEARPVHGWGYGFGSGYNAHRYRTRWSMYAHDLVSGVVNYSPYATVYSGTGLVEGYVRYSPYAFGGGNPGLVSDYGSGRIYGFAPANCYIIHQNVPTCYGFKSSGASESCQLVASARTRQSYTETIEQRKARRTALAKARERRIANRANDGKEIIAGYLRGNNIPFRTTRILNIEGKTVSVDFLLNDGKTIIKYWDPSGIPSKDKQEQRQRKFFENYVESWKVARDEHLETGGTVYQIISSDCGEILTWLPQCLDLNGSDRVFASAQGELSRTETP